MKTLLLSHVYLDCEIPGYRGEDGGCRRLERFLHHYSGAFPTLILDNGSSMESWFNAWERYQVPILPLQPHYKRGLPIGGTNHDYASAWRNYWVIRDLLQCWERILFIATDAFVVSQRLMDWLLSIESGWVTLWSPEYKCPASEIQVITRGCKAFEDFFAGPCDPYKYNGLHEEMVLPFTMVEKGFAGDRYGEFVPVPPFIDYNGEIDYFTQVPDHPEFDDAQFPVVRRVNGKVVVA